MMWLFGDRVVKEGWMGQRQKKMRTPMMMFLLVDFVE